LKKTWQPVVNQWLYTCCCIGRSGLSNGRKAKGRIQRKWLKFPQAVDGALTMLPMAKDRVDLFLKDYADAVKGAGWQ